MTTVYMVTADNYEGCYWTVGIFSTPEKAEECRDRRAKQSADKGLDRGYEIELWTIDEGDEEA